MLPYIIILTLIGLLILSWIFKISAKLRLTIPLIYLILCCTVFSPWASAHEPLALGILLFLTIICLLSWVYTLRQKLKQRRYQKLQEEALLAQLHKARQAGYKDQDIIIDASGVVRDRETDSPIL